MTLIKRGSNYSFFAAFFCTCLEFNDLLALPTKEWGNKGIKLKKGAVNCCIILKTLNLCYFTS